MKLDFGVRVYNARKSYIYVYGTVGRNTHDPLLAVLLAGRSGFSYETVDDMTSKLAVFLVAMYLP